MEYSSAMKSNEVMAFVATYMDLEIIMLREVRQWDKKCHMLSPIHGIEKKDRMIFEEQILTLNNLPKQTGWGGSMGWGFTMEAL